MVIKNVSESRRGGGGGGVAQSFCNFELCAEQLQVGEYKYIYIYLLKVISQNASSKILSFMKQQ